LCEPEVLRDELRDERDELRCVFRRDERPELRELLRCGREELLRFLERPPDDDLRGTFAPSRRASESPMAMACSRLVTFLPLRPLFNVPCFFSCIARSTFLPAFGLYSLPPEDLCGEDRLVAMNILPSSEWEADADEEVARRGSRQATFAM
jgi:hypothetical protein